MCCFHKFISALFLSLNIRKEYPLLMLEITLLAENSCIYLYIPNSKSCGNFITPRSTLKFVILPYSTR